MVESKLLLESVQGEVELQDVDPRLAQKPELAALHMLLDELPDRVLCKTA